MKNAISKNLSYQSLATLADGKLKVNSVDQFPSADVSHYKDNGFPSSDIGLLDRFSRDHAPKETLDYVASRMAEIKASPSNKMSDDELLATLKPAWCQTAAEMAQYQEQIYTYMVDKRASNISVTASDGAASSPDASSSASTE